MKTLVQFLLFGLTLALKDLAEPKVVILGQTGNEKNALKYYRHYDRTFFCAEKYLFSTVDFKATNFDENWIHTFLKFAEWVWKCFIIWLDSKEYIIVFNF